jgi:hypothetical protein
MGRVDKNRSNIINTVNFQLQKIIKRERKGPRILKITIRKSTSWALVAHACNLSYSGGRDQED